MKTVSTGANGQPGTDLTQFVCGDVVGLSHSDVDICDRKSVSLNDGTQFDDYYDLTTDYLINTQVMNLIASGCLKDITTLMK